VTRRPSLRGARIVVTGGPTREHLDDVRFITNASTGRMGIELARAAVRRGARVALVLGPTSLRPPAGVDVMAIVSTADLLEATRRAIVGAHAAIFAAAPADWRPARRRRGKPAREGGTFQLALRPTTDVAATLGRRKAGRIHVGFALEVTGGERRAKAKMRRKKLDAIVLNSLANMGRGGGRAAWIEEEGTSRLPTTSKPVLARAILDRLARRLAAGR
jgi:phosphopantothenoylcysteine decarboxylase/phosphopantothenate--cysteine ligase